MEYSKESHERTFDILDKQNEKLESILIQATKTNGRVTALEAKQKEVLDTIDKNTQDISHFKGRENWILGAIGAIMLVSGFVIKSVMDSIEYQIVKITKQEINLYEESQNNKNIKKTDSN
jgi:hypothetical protein